MGFSFADFAAGLKAGAVISAQDVLEVRRWAWPDGTISTAEAQALFELNRSAKNSAPEWDDFFVEAITDYVVNATAPRGYVDEAHAAWLIGQIDRAGAPVKAVELALVVKIVESSLNCPQSLKTWALGRIEAAVLSGGIIDEAEVNLLRRLVFAPGGEGALVVGADEAELLWRLKDATLGADNAPGWKTLFVQAVGNHLMAFSSYKPLERDEAARLDAFVEDHRSNVLGFFARMSKAKPLTAFGHGAPPIDRDAAIAAANSVTPDEEKWLGAHVDADGARDPLEEALLAFVADESKAP